MPPTRRERLLKLLRGEPIDRIPISPRIHEYFIFEFFNRTDVDLVEGAAEVYRHFGMDTIDWNCTPNPHFEWIDFEIPGPKWEPHLEVIRQDENTTHHVTTVNTPKGELRRVFTYTQLTPFERELALTEHPIKSERDFDLLLEYQPPVGEFDTSSIGKARRVIGEDGINSPSFHGPFNILANYLRKLDDLVMDVYDNQPFYHRMMEYALQRILKYAQMFVDAGADMIDIGTNVANGRLVSAPYLVEHVLPYENRLADFLQERGVPALYHNCGYAAAHLKEYHRLHHKIWGYMAPPPYGDTEPEQAAALPRELILWGGIDQITFLRTATPAQVRQKVRELIDIMKPRGNYILGTTDYLETHTPHENLRAFVEAGLEFGSYTEAPSPTPLTPV